MKEFCMAMKMTTRAIGMAVVMAAALSACAVPEPQPVRTPLVAQHLVGVQWVALTVGGEVPVVDPKPQLRWTSPTLVVGVGGCNRFFGPATVAGDNLRIGPLSATGKACMTAPSGQEDLFFKALEQTRSARLEQGQLVLLDESGKVVMRLATATKQP